MRRWQNKPLIQVLKTFETGSRPSGGVNTFTDGIPSLGGEHLTKDGSFVFSPIKYVPEDFFKEMPRGHIQRNDILVVKDGATTGKTAFVSEVFPFERASINEHVFLLRANNDQILPKYLFFFLFSQWGQAQILACYKGAAIGGISRDFASIVQVPLPPLSEQERVVRILDEADQLRRLRAEANRRTADLIPATFYEMFGNPPKTWPVAKFGDLGTLDRGRSKHRPRDEANLFGGPYPFIQTGDIANSGGCVEAYTQTYSELGLSQSKLWPERTLCITIAANIAKCAVLSFPACFPDSVVGFIPNELILVEFAQSWLETLQAKLEDEAPQAAQKNINLQTLRNLELRVPPVELQRTFAVRVSEIREMGAEQAASRRRLDDLFQSLLHRAFQGEL